MKLLISITLFLSLASVQAQWAPVDPVLVASDPVLVDAPVLIPEPVPEISVDPLPVVESDPVPVVPIPALERPILRREPSNVEPKDDSAPTKVGSDSDVKDQKKKPRSRPGKNTGIVPPQILPGVVPAKGSDAPKIKSPKRKSPALGSKKGKSRKNKSLDDDDDDAPTRRVQRRKSSDDDAPRRKKSKGRSSHNHGPTRRSRRHGTSDGKRRKNHKRRSSDDNDDDVPTRRQREVSPGDLRDLAGKPCADQYSQNKCNYLKAQGLCSSKSSSHVRKAWKGCRSTCGLCTADVPNCAPGYRFNQALQQCADIDECAESSFVCASNANCVNTEGSYDCKCNDGFVGKGKTQCQASCADVSVNCAKYSAQCFLASSRIFLSKNCPVTCGVCSVKCAKGYKVGSDGKTCVNVNECLEKTDKCPAHSTCVDSEGSYRCSCNIGYTYNVITQSCTEYCTDNLADCGSRKSKCSTGTSAEQAWMSTYCPATCQLCDQPRCAPGYKLNNGKCVDVDECSSPKLNKCVANAKCVNTEGSYSCGCKNGYKGNGFVKCTTKPCYDLLPLEQCQAMSKSGGCHALSGKGYRLCAKTCKVCTNDAVKSCAKGYVARNGLCIDVNECKALTHRCPSNSQCFNTWGGYQCKCSQGLSPSKSSGKWACVRQNTCFVAGDPHIQTFDGQLFQWQGTCKYTLVTTIKKVIGILSEFSIVIENERRGGDLKMSWTKSVTIEIFGVTILLDKGKKVYVNGKKISLPYSPRPGIVITVSSLGPYVSLSNGVTVVFDGNHYVKVSAPDAYSKKLGGLCGNLDKNPANDLTTKEGLRTPSYAKIANSWAVPDPDKFCQPATDDDSSDCSKDVLKQVIGDGQCGIIKSPKGPFANCIKKVDYSLAYESCVMDVCQPTAHPEALCRSLQSFADRCQTNGITVNWRSDSLCPLTCGKDSVYSPAMSACPATCANPGSEATCSQLPQEGCDCVDGTVLDGNQQCIPVSDCGCQLNGVYHPTNEEWLDDTCSFKFTCLPQSTILKVPVTCQDSGTCQIKDNKVGCYCNDPTAGNNCEVPSGVPQVVPNDPGYDPTAPILPPNVVQITTTTPAPTPVTTPAYIPPHPDGEIADDEYFLAPPPPPPPPKARPLGVESGVIPDKNIQASSSTPSDPPTKARPNSRGGWAHDPTDKEPSITTDLGKPMDVHGVGTVGHYSKPCWTTNYNVYVSNDGQNFTPLLDTRPEYNTQPRNFIGNSDQNTWKKHCLHQYYGSPINTRYIRIVPLANNGCPGLRHELYGFRAGNDAGQVRVLQKDQWTRTTSGCSCYFDGTSTECACCYAGGCQCPRSNLHQCVQCGNADMCGTPEIKPTDEQIDPWTISETGCQCNFDPTRFDCACCQKMSCQCGQENKNQCVTCGHPEHCGQKEDVFGPSDTCVPKTCPGK